MAALGAGLRGLVFFIFLINQVSQFIQISQIIQVIQFSQVKNFYYFFIFFIFILIILIKLNFMNWIKTVINKRKNLIRSFYSIDKSELYELYLFNNLSYKALLRGLKGFWVFQGQKAFKLDK